MKSKLENRTKIIKARVTENEKCLLETKCKYYGYKMSITFENVSKKIKH